MSEPTIDELLDWFDTITQWIHDKPEYKAIRAILEQHRDAVVISKAQWAVLCELNIRGAND